MIGKCYQCGAKIGRISANGHYRPDLRVSNQIEIEYSDTTIIIPVCLKCFADVNVKDIEKNIKGKGKAKSVKADQRCANFKKKNLGKEDKFKVRS